MPNLAPLPPPPESSVNMYELTFGTVCGIFVLLQVSAALHISRDAIPEVRSNKTLYK